MSSRAATVCVVSHDAGGAEILASYVAQSALDCRFVLAGPAVQVFERRLGAIRVDPLGEALAASTWCLLGTGWQSDLEWQALGEAKRLSRRAVSFLDHWVNYEERFERGGVRRLPDEIWVGDQDALALAQLHFPGTPVKLVPNPYFADVAREVARHDTHRPAARPGQARVLFVCENLSGIGRQRFGDERHLGYTEFDALEYFFSRAAELGVEGVRIRPHPSDPPGKYDALIAGHAPLAQPGGDRPLLEEIAAADIVAGCESMALIAALIARRRVLCCVPPGKKVAFIDRRRGVEMLRDLPARSTTSA
jgi:hypothetical protein